MSGLTTDRWGASIQSRNERGVPLFDAAVAGLVSISGDPVGAVEAAVEADDDLVLAHILRAYLHLYATSAEGVSNARKVLEGFDGVTDLDEREVLHLRAARSWASGEWDEATHFLERALLHDSRDLLALKVAQDLYFFLGQSRGVRGVVARVLGAWPPDRAGWGYVLGMHAFGLEETGDYERAEICARAALQNHATPGQPMHWPMYSRCRGGSRKGWTSWMPRRNIGRRAPSQFITGGTTRCITSDRVISTGYSPPTTGPFGAPGHPNGSIWSTPLPSCGASHYSGTTSKIAFNRWPSTWSPCSVTPSTSSTIGTPSWSSAWSALKTSTSGC